jgi:hypothetical protein
MLSEVMNRFMKISIGSSVALTALLVSGPAAAATVPVSPGGSLSLTATNSGNNNSANSATGKTSSLSAGGGYTYANGFNGKQTTNFSTTSFGFYDDYVISIGAGQVDSITSTITIGSAAGISGLAVRLYDYTANGGVAPLLAKPATGSAFDSWSTTVPVFPGVSATYNVLPPTTLTSGTYVVEVRGTASGTSGGAYGGIFNLTPVPLPGALPLLLSSFGLVGGFAVRQRRAAV